MVIVFSIAFWQDGHNSACDLFRHILHCSRFHNKVEWMPCFELWCCIIRTYQVLFQIATLCFQPTIIQLKTVLYKKSVMDLIIRDIEMGIFFDITFCWTYIRDMSQDGLWIWILIHLLERNLLLKHIIFCEIHIWYHNIIRKLLLSSINVIMIKVVSLSLNKERKILLPTFWTIRSFSFFVAF